jgi:hypothetical protein
MERRVEFRYVGRTPSSALDPLVRLFAWKPKADEGAGPRTGGSPHLALGDFQRKPVCHAAKERTARIVSAEPERLGY